MSMLTQDGIADIDEVYNLIECDIEVYGYLSPPLESQVDKLNRVKDFIDEYRTD